MGNKLGGSLIGYAIKHNGTFRKVLFDKPIHNTITKSCLQNLLQWNGSDALCTTDITGNYLSLFAKSSETSNRYGTFNFSALGNDNTPTTVDDVMLYNQIGSYTSTKMSGDGWCGSTIDGNSAIIRTRISHIHTITDTFTVRLGIDAFALKQSVTQGKQGDRAVHGSRVNIYIAHFAGQVLGHRALSARRVAVNCYRNLFHVLNGLLVRVNKQR